MTNAKNGPNKLTLTILKTKLAIYQLEAGKSIDSHFLEQTSEFLSITRTADELSIVSDENSVPKNISNMTNGWRALKVDNGPLDFSLIGILSSILNLLAQAEISIFSISTFNTDYILIKEENLTNAVQALKEQYIIKN